jgi:HrpA-like RNA helicase
VSHRIPAEVLIDAYNSTGDLLLKQSLVQFNYSKDNTFSSFHNTHGSLKHKPGVTAQNVHKHALHTKMEISMKKGQYKGRDATYDDYVQKQGQIVTSLRNATKYSGSGDYACNMVAHLLGTLSGSGPGYKKMVAELDTRSFATDHKAKDIILLARQERAQQTIARVVRKRAYKLSFILQRNHPKRLLHTKVGTKSDLLAPTDLKRQLSDEAKAMLSTALNNGSGSDDGGSVSGGDGSGGDPKLLAALQRWTLRGKKALAAALGTPAKYSTRHLAIQCEQKFSDPEGTAAFARFVYFANEVAGKRWLEEGETYQAITKRLPVYIKKQEIIEQLRASKSLVLTAQTGAGKTTQIPQYFIDHIQASGTRGSCAVLVPTRTIARGLASHVAELRGGKVGEEVGYALGGGDVKKGKKMTIMTYGYFLHGAYANDPTLQRYSAVFVDEAHTRSIDSDIVLSLARDAQSQRSEPLWVVAMSATIDPVPFQRHLGDCAHISVSGRTFPVDVHYESLPGGLDPHALSKTAASIAPAAAQLAARLHQSSGAGYILVFMPGRREIEEGCRVCQQLVDGGAEVLPIYSALPPGEQARVINFKRNHNGDIASRRLIAFGTNVCQAGVTIDGLKFVIDSGLEKQADYDSEKQESTLGVEWISQADAQQRKGRAGRTAPGVCYRLYPEAIFGGMATYNPPEIIRESCEAVVLKLASAGCSARTFDFLTPPNSAALDQAYDSLQKLGALSGESLTRIGEQMCHLSQFISSRAARFALHCNEYGCGMEGLAIGYILDSFTASGVGQVLRSRRMDWTEPEKAFYDQEIKNITKDCTSDHIALYLLFEQGSTTTVDVGAKQRAKKTILEAAGKLSGRGFSVTSGGNLAEVVPSGLALAFFHKVARLNSRVAQGAAYDGATFLVGSNIQKQASINGGSVLMKRAKVEWKEAVHSLTIFHKIRDDEDGKFRMQVLTPIDEKLLPNFEPAVDIWKALPKDWAACQMMLGSKTEGVYGLETYPNLKKLGATFASEPRVVLKITNSCKLKSGMVDPDLRGIYICAPRGMFSQVKATVMAHLKSIEPAKFKLTGFPAKVVGAFIGKGAENIKRLQANLCTQFGIPVGGLSITGPKRDSEGPDAAPRTSMRGEKALQPSITIVASSATSGKRTKICKAVADDLRGHCPLVYFLSFSVDTPEPWRLGLQKRQSDFRKPASCAEDVWVSFVTSPEYLAKQVENQTARSGPLTTTPSLRQDHVGVWVSCSGKDERHAQAILREVQRAMIPKLIVEIDGIHEDVMRGFIGRGGSNIKRITEAFRNFGGIQCSSGGVLRAIVHNECNHVAAVDFLKSELAKCASLEFTFCGVEKMGWFFGKGGCNIKALQASVRSCCQPFYVQVLVEGDDVILRGTAGDGALENYAVGLVQEACENACEDDDNIEVEETGGVCIPEPLARYIHVKTDMIQALPNVKTEKVKPEVRILSFIQKYHSLPAVFQACTEVSPVPGVFSRLPSARGSGSGSSGGSGRSRGSISDGFN